MAKSNLLETLQRDLKKSSKKLSVTKFHKKFLMDEGVDPLFPHQIRWLKEIRKFLKHKTQHYLMILSPRDSRKTSTIVYSLVLWLIYNNPNIRILILGKSATQAEKSLMALKQTIENNQKLKDEYGDIRGDPWTYTKLTVKRDRKDLKEPTIESGGIDSPTTGGHYDVIILDDLVDIENSRTEERRRYIRTTLFATIHKLRDEDSKLFVIGTRKHPDDLYNTIMEGKTYIKKIYRAFTKYPDNWFKKFTYTADDEGVLTGVEVQEEEKWEALFPEKWDVKTLLLDRAEDYITFDRERMNDVSGMVGKMFKDEWIHLYKREDLPEDLLIFIGVDPAATKDLEASIADGEADPELDWFSIVVIGGDPVTGRLYYLHHIIDRIGFSDQLAMLESYNETYKPVAIGIESDAYQIALAQQLWKNTMANVIAMKSKNIDKVSRKFSLIPNIASGRIAFPGVIDDSPIGDGGMIYEPGDCHSFLKDFLLPFPDCKHDDPVDAFEKAIEAALMYIKAGDGVVDWDAASGHRTFNARSSAEDIAADNPLVSPVEPIDYSLFDDSGGFSIDPTDLDLFDVSRLGIG